MNPPHVAQYPVTVLTEISCPVSEVGLNSQLRFASSDTKSDVETVTPNLGERFIASKKIL